MDQLIAILEILGLNVGLLSFAFLCIWLGTRLVRFGSNIVATGKAPAHSWNQDRPPHDVKIPKIIGGYIVFCGSIGYFFAACATISALIIDAIILMGVAGF